MKYAAMKGIVAIAIFLGACSHTHTRVDAGASSAQGSVNLHVEGGRSLAALLGLSLLAGGIYEAQRTGFDADSRSAPELDPSRRINEQDCTKPFDYSLGNIRCK